MKVNNIYKFIFLFILLNSCSTYNYFTNDEESYNYAGEWILNNDSNKKLEIIKTEKNLYSLKFYSNLGDWESIGYQVENELLSIFKYKNKNEKGYLTFSVISIDKIYYKSINTDGEFRSSGNYYRIKFP